MIFFRAVPKSRSLFFRAVQRVLKQNKLTNQLHRGYLAPMQQNIGTSMPTRSLLHLSVAVSRLGRARLELEVVLVEGDEPAGSARMEGDSINQHRPCHQYCLDAESLHEKYKPIYSYIYMV